MMIPSYCFQRQQQPKRYLRLTVFNQLLLAILALLPLPSASSSTYTAVTALDKFGNAQQVRNAREAAIRYGRLVVAAKYHAIAAQEESVVVVLTLLDERPDLVTESPYESAPRTVQLLNHLLPPPPFDPSLPPHNDHYQNKHPLIALACTGIKPDAVWLMETIRDYVKRVWQRYDTFSYSVNEMANAVSQAMGSFWNHPKSQEWNHGAGPVVDNTESEDDNSISRQQTSWSRPLGVQALVLSTRPRDPLVVVEPSGVVTQASSKAVAIGQYSEEVLRLLIKKLESSRGRGWKNCDELIHVMIQAVRQTVGSDYKKKRILIEILSSRGIERQLHS